MNIKFNSNKRSKAGFTIVELVIVIAVIGILSAILIPTFVGLVNKASVSADVMTVKNINTQLKISEETNGKPETFSQMLSAASEAGYDVNKLNPTTDGYSIVWDMSQNLLFLYDKDGNLADNQAETPSENKSDLWSMTTETPAENLAENSIAGNVYLNNDSVESVTVSYGIEVSGETDVNFTTTNSGTYNVVLNGGNLTVNAENATVNSYGAKNQVTVTAVDMNNSYHEFGTVNGNVYLKKGHLSIENNSHVYAVVITATSVNDVKVDVKNSSSIETGVAATSSEVSSALVNNSNFNIPEDKKVTEVIDSETASKYAGGFGTEASPYLIDNETQFNAITYVASKIQYFKLTNDIEFTKYNGTGDYYIVNRFKGVLDGDGHSITLPLNPTNSTIWNALFNYTYSDSVIKNVNVYYTGFTSLDENSQSWSNLVSQVEGSTTFENINLYNADGTIIKINTNNYGVLASYAIRPVTVINCNNYVNLVSTATGGTGVWFGVFNTANVNTFTNVNNYASINGATIGYFLGNELNLYANINSLKSYTLEEIKSHIVVTDCYNYGIITTTGSNRHYIGYSTVEYSEAYTQWEEELDKVFNKTATASFTKLTHSEDFTATVNEDNSISINKPEDDRIASYKIVYNTMYKSAVDESHGSFALVLNFDEQTNYKCKFDNISGNETLESKGYTVISSVSASESANGFAYSICSKDGESTIYYVFSDIVIPGCESPTLANSSVSITVYAYDVNGNIVDYVRV